MAAVDLNVVRKTIEERLTEEFTSGPFIPLIFNNIPFDASPVDEFIQCTTSFGASSYLTQGGNTNSTNNIAGLIVLNIFTKEGVGSGGNFAICKRLRDL